MRIKLSGRNTLLAFRNDEGGIFLVTLVDYSGRVNFQMIVRNYLKEEGFLVATRVVEKRAKQFLVCAERPLMAVDMLKIAIRIQRRLQCFCQN